MIPKPVHLRFSHLFRGAWDFCLGLLLCNWVHITVEWAIHGYSTFSSLSTNETHICHELLTDAPQIRSNLTKTQLAGQLLQVRWAWSTSGKHGFPTLRNSNNSCLTKEAAELYSS